MLTHPVSRMTVTCPGLPLAVYREVSAHLQQVEGVITTLNPQQSTQFDYAQSQIGSLEIRFADTIQPTERARVDQILQYYGDRYGAWQPLA